MDAWREWTDSESEGYTSDADTDVAEAEVLHGVRQRLSSMFARADEDLEVSRLEKAMSNATLESYEQSLFDREARFAELKQRVQRAEAALEAVQNRLAHVRHIQEQLFEGWMASAAFNLPEFREIKQKMADDARAISALVASREFDIRRLRLQMEEAKLSAADAETLGRVSELRRAYFSTL